MSTRWKGNLICIAMEWKFGTYSALDEEQYNEDELGLWFHQAYMIKFRSSGQNKGLKNICK
jgi:hypothetical protein